MLKESTTLEESTVTEQAPMIRLNEPEPAVAPNDRKEGFDATETAGSVMADRPVPEGGCNETHTASECQQKLRPVKDAIYVLSGKWKIPIIISLSFGPRRFKQIATDLEGITDKVLSKELKELEQNELLEREVFNTFPPRVEYRATEYARSLQPVINSLREWGMGHRNRLMKKS